MSVSRVFRAALAGMLMIGAGAARTIDAASGAPTGGQCALAGDGIRNCRIALPTGVTMAYAEAGRRGGPVVILLHGFPDTGSSWARVLPQLRRLLPGDDIIVPDLRGHGSSSLPIDPSCPQAPVTCFRPIDFARDIVALMDARGIGHASIVGHSMGTLVAQELGLTFPGRVDRLVLISTAADGTEPAVAALRDQVIDGWWEAAFTAAGYTWPDDVYALNPAVAVDGYAEFIAGLQASAVAPQMFLDEVRASSAATPLGTWIGTVDGIAQANNVPRLRRLRAPTLILYGIQDDIFSPADEQRLIDALRAGGCGHDSFWWKQYGAVPPASGEQIDLGHNLPWEAPLGVARDVAAFLRFGRPTRTLYRTDPDDVTKVIAEPGRAVVRHYIDHPRRPRRPRSGASTVLQPGPRTIPGARSPGHRDCG